MVVPHDFALLRSRNQGYRSGSCTGRRDCNVATRGRQVTSLPRWQMLGRRQTPLAPAGLQTFPEPRDRPTVQGWHAATGQAPCHSPDTRRSERLAEDKGLGTHLLAVWWRLGTPLHQLITSWRLGMNWASVLGRPLPFLSKTTLGSQGRIVGTELSGTQ